MFQANCKLGLSVPLLAQRARLGSDEVRRFLLPTKARSILRWCDAQPGNR